MADMIFDNVRDKFLGGNFGDLTGATLKCCLLTSSYTPDETDAVYGDLSNEVANGNGYTTGGVTLANVTITETSDVAKLDADDATWTSSTFSCRYAVVYVDGATKHLLCLKDLGAVSVTNGPLTVQWHANGILRLT